MPIKNYTTAVPADRTVGEISALLIRKGAREITSQYDNNGKFVGIRFMMLVGGVPCCFQLPANIDGVFRVLLRDEPFNFRRASSKTDYEAKLRDRAEWVAWRILKDWIDAQIAIIESGQVEPAQVFMPFAITGNNITMFEAWVESNQKRLSATSQVN
ncbi:hypothetical protein [Alloacidobacterium sp.]|uniref:hypothetical protein n=1 Tax=Alloacidobacterium sp. TaxID=2951999 RepID=UPI002D266A2F|nr:hypothetical protein [Alloacidobacterium sp.]HYK34713.1 hypothetical protein [Alloacidobacterium sp.]